MQITAAEAARLCGGQLICGDPMQKIANVVLDSREAKVGSLFVPLVGERTNSHQYIPSVLAAGAASLTQEKPAQAVQGTLIQVENTSGALQQMAKAYRRQFTLPVVGITGSVGKTTTKEMVALALSARYNVMKTQGNQNSQLGVPLTMFQLDETTQAAVVEMGMSQFGEMERLSKIVVPQYAVMTNIGISHIENLHTQENIRKEKLHITDAFTKDSVLILNGDDKLLAELRSSKVPYHIVFVGTQPWCDYRAVQAENIDGCSHFVLEHGETQLSVTLPVLGAHQITNALAALAAADVLNVPLKAAAKALGTYKPLAMRQQIHKTKMLTVIDDSYNASPDAMRGALNVLGSFPHRQVAVLADMLELGEASHQAHFDCGCHAAQVGVDLLVTVGTEAAALAEGAKKSGKTISCKCFLSNAEAITFLRTTLQPGDTVLVKGSRGMHTDEIVAALLNF